MSYTNKRLFSRFLNKAVSMALWTKVSLRGESLLSERSLPSTPNRLKNSLCPLWALWLYSSCLRGEKIREIRVNPWLHLPYDLYLERFVSSSFFSFSLAFRPFFDIIQGVRQQSNTSPLRGAQQGKFHARKHRKTRFIRVFFLL